MAKPSKASVRALIEALISHNIGMLNRSSTNRLFDSLDSNVIKERIGNALFNEDFLKERIVLLSLDTIGSILLVFSSDIT